MRLIPIRRRRFVSELAAAATRVAIETAVMPVMPVLHRGRDDGGTRDLHSSDQTRQGLLGPLAIALEVIREGSLCCDECGVLFAPVLNRVPRAGSGSYVAESSLRSGELS